MDQDAHVIDRLPSVRSDAPAMQQKKLCNVEQYIMAGSACLLSPVTGRSTLLLLAANPSKPTHSYPLLSSSQMDSTSYTVSQTAQVEQPVDMDQSSNGSVYCVIA